MARIVEIAAVTLLALAGSAPVRGDLLATRPGDGLAQPAVLRFDEVSGAFVTNFTSGRFDESMAGCVFGPDNNLYVTVNDLGEGAVLRYDGSSGVFLDEFVPLGSGGPMIPFALRFGTGGDLFVASAVYTNFTIGPGQILRYNGTNGAFRQTFVANGAGGLTCPFDFVFGPDGNLYVADGVYATPSGGAGVLRYNGSSGAFMGKFIARASGGLTNASGIIFGPDGNCYVSSFSTDTVLKYNGTNGAFIGSFVPSGSGGLDGPQALAFGPDGQLYVCSALNHAVLRYDGKTGAFVDVFVMAGSGGLSSGPSGLTFTPRAPKLTIARSGPSLLLSWPRAATNYVLDFTQTLTDSNNWAPVGTVPAILGDAYVVTNSPSASQEFFRLRKQ